jgi:FlaA1/EpsC-like NDP-sugar epimerase
MNRMRSKSLLFFPLLAAVVLAYIAAFLLRFEFAIPGSVREPFRLGLMIFFPIKGLLFWKFRIHTSRWRLVSLFDLIHIAVANLSASALVCIVTAVVVGPVFPRSIYIIDAALCFLATAGVPFSIRLYWEVLVPNTAETRNPKMILIYGAGVAGSALSKEIRSNVKLGTRVAGFLDDDKTKQGSSLAGIPILGAGADAAHLVALFAERRKPISEIIIAMPSATGKQLRAAIAHCRTAGVPFKTLPGVAELLSGRISTQVRQVSANDLLGREPVRIDESRISQTIAGRSVLVTGGCGSIGSELCRQIARFSPEKLIILDQAESDMFMLALELRKRFPELNLFTEIGDICRPARVRDVIARHGIRIVFHAAAYKHVPLMEENIAEAIQNNVIGTYNVVRAAYRAHVERFVLISSDKAVNPTSIMGLTKRIAEILVSSMPLDGRPEPGAFVSVRFGNVLGSAGSVIPIFQRQIAAGGPVTVTDARIQRYFMSIAEAVQLVLQASTMGEGSEVFVLDMGEPVRIMDLANNMIRLAGLVPGEDIEIRITGLRPGEKLFEELQLGGEDILPTPHEKIRRFRSAPPDAMSVARWLERLRILLMYGDVDALKTHLVLLVPEYQGSVAVKGREETGPLVWAAAHAS